ncbi:MAG: hypothetical protein U9O55_03315, partial [Patescibacteria group bacterium]|nr:hypothetical protein [Patescibacteria group bacterium]
MNSTNNRKKIISIITFFIFAILFSICAYNLKISSASIECCHHECNLTDPKKCVGNTVYECQLDCDADLYQDWCEVEDCSATGQTCVDGVCVSSSLTCSDNTSYNACSINTGAPWYCNSSGSLVENCGTCGCAGSWVCGPSNTFCCDNQCNSSCSPSGCTVAYDPDCACQDNNSCCGIGCNNANDNDCPLADNIDPFVSSFTALNNVNDVDIGWNVSDSGGSHLDRIEIWRATDNGGIPVAWAEVG